MADRIRWHEGGSETDITAWHGYAGTVNAPLFSILRPVPGTADLPGRTDEWALTAHFPGSQGGARYGDGPDELKQAAEEWFAEIITSLGAGFPEPAWPVALDAGELDAGVRISRTLAAELEGIEDPLTRARLLRWAAGQYEIAVKTLEAGL